MQQDTIDCLLLPAIDPQYSVTTTLDEAIINLDVVSKIQKGERLSTTDDYLHIETANQHTTNSILRMIYGDSRRRAIVKIFKYVYAVVEFSEHIRESKYLSLYDKMSNIIHEEDENNFVNRVQTLKKIEVTLDGAATGLQNFIYTYCNDTAFINKIQTLIKYIEIKKDVIARDLETVLRRKTLFDQTMNRR